MRKGKLIRCVLFGGVFVVAGWFPAVAEAANLRIRNETNCFVAVNVDGAYGCSTAARTYCDIPVSVGRHCVSATCTSTGDRSDQVLDVPAAGFIWTLN